MLNFYGDGNKAVSKRIAKAHEKHGLYLKKSVERFMDIAILF